MNAPLYPLRFDPIFQYRLWGGRALGAWMNVSLPGDGPFGEAWLLSDRDDHASRIANGPLAGHSITDLMKTSKRALLGDLAEKFERFPLLLKFLDVQKMLSVQVHPRDDQSILLPDGETGKTEAWIVLRAGKGSRIYAGLQPGTTAKDLRMLTAVTVDKHLTSFAPEEGQVVLLRAGIVHALGGGMMVFEVQENSDVTFRLFDWGHVDERTGKLRDLQVDQALACIDLEQGAVTPVPSAAMSTRPGTSIAVVDPHFRVFRTDAVAPFEVGARGEARVLVCIGGSGVVEHQTGNVEMTQGATILLPADVGICRFVPHESVVLLEIAISLSC